jgi:hypothetical protein
VTAAIGVAILAVAAIWIFGSPLARWAGVLLFVVGAVGLATTGDGNGFLLVAFGGALWLAGHLLYRARRGAWKSALAERLCLLPCRSASRIDHEADPDGQTRGLSSPQIPNPGG